MVRMIPDKAAQRLCKFTNCGRFGSSWHSGCDCLDIELMNTLLHVLWTFVDCMTSLSSSHIQPVAKMSFHWPSLHWSASTVARDHVASSVLLEFHRYVPGVKKDATITASCLKNSYELKNTKTWKKHGKKQTRVILLCQKKGLGSIGVMNSTRKKTRFFRAHAKNLGHAMCNDVDKSTKKCKTCDFHVEMDRILRWFHPGSKTTRITTAWQMDTWTVLDDYSENIFKKTSKIKSHLLESTGERSPFACELRLNLHAETGAR